MNSDRSLRRPVESGWLERAADVGAASDTNARAQACSAGSSPMS